LKTVFSHNSANGRLISLKWSEISEGTLGWLRLFGRTDDSDSMTDRILYIASLAFRAVQHLLDRSEARRRQCELKQWCECTPAPAKTRQPVRIAEIGRR
jgi:hypothetical protein